MKVKYAVVIHMAEFYNELITVGQSMTVSYHVNEASHRVSSMVSHSLVNNNRAGKSGTLPGYSNPRQFDH